MLANQTRQSHYISSISKNQLLYIENISIRNHNPYTLLERGDMAYG